MAYNNNYGFKYPGGEDLYNVEDFNKNFDMVSDELDDIIDMLGDKAPALHKHEADEITGVLTVENGGTGSGTASGARENLGLGTAALRDVIEQMTATEESTDIPTEKAVSTFVLEHIGKKQGKYSYVVAAYNSNESMKQYADFILDENGTNINELQKFIDDMPRGSAINMLTGTYVLTNTLYLNKSIIIEGNGHSTVFECDKNFGGDMICINNTGSTISNVTLKNLTLRNEEEDGRNTVNLINMKDVNGAYIYNVRFGYNIGTAGSQVSLIKGEGYLRNIHIHDCVMNSTMESPADESYTIDLDGVSNAGELCVFISGCSYNTSGEFDIRVHDSSYLTKLALYGFTGQYNIYDTSNRILKTVSNGTFDQEVMLNDGTDI